MYEKHKPCTHNKICICYLLWLLSFFSMPGYSGYKLLAGGTLPKLVVVGEFPCLLTDLEKKLRNNTREKLETQHAARLHVVGRDEFFRQFARAGQYEMNSRRKPAIQVTD